MENGKFIVLEGNDLAGKTTISQLVIKWLSSDHNIEATLTRHPGSTPVGKQLREILKHSPEPINSNAQALLFAADNSLFMDQILGPSIKQGKWIIGDRNNFISSLAYQISSGCSLEELDLIHDATTQTAKIDLLLIFKCDWLKAQSRKTIRNPSIPDRYEDAGRAYFENLIKCYDSIANDNIRLSKFMNNTSNVYYIDANKEIDEVFNNVKSIISKVLL